MEMVRKVIETEFQCFKTAFEVTQFLRGNLYIFLDLVLAADHKEEDLEKIYEFLHEVIKLIVLWLKLLSDKFLKSFIETQSNPKLYLIDKNCALASCGFELMDILKWLFCLTVNVLYMCVENCSI